MEKKSIFSKDGQFIKKALKAGYTVYDGESRELFVKARALVLDVNFLIVRSSLVEHDGVYGDVERLRLHAQIQGLEEQGATPKGFVNWGNQSGAKDFQPVRQEGGWTISASGGKIVERSNCIVAKMQNGETITSILAPMSTRVLAKVTHVMKDGGEVCSMTEVRKKQEMLFLLRFQSQLESDGEHHQKA
jgi:hypothetical protein